MSSPTFENPVAVVYGSVAKSSPFIKPVLLTPRLDPESTWRR